MTRLKYGLLGLLVSLLLSLDKPANTKTNVRDVFESTDTNVIDTSKFHLNRLGTGNYSIDLHHILSDKTFLLSLHKAAISDSARAVNLERAGELIESTLVNKVFHYWYGTPWDFNGYTNVPNKGTVACGYFVSTTLKHIGFNVNRYKLAQQNPRNEALSLSCGDTIFEFNNVSAIDVVDSLSAFTPGLYFVGLGNHVGYVLVRQQNVFFIHSNYLGDIGVTMEFAKYSDAFLSSSSFTLARISHNPILVRKWLKSEEIKVVTSSE